MGIHDRDYMQAGARPMPIYRPGRLVWLFIAINGVLWFVFSSMLNNAATRVVLHEGEQVRIFDPASTYIAFREALLLWPSEVFGAGKVWQLFTAFWLHDPYSVSHVLFNMFALFMFGRVVETFLGPKRFLALYLGAGLFASLVYTGWSALVGNTIPALGASGAVFAVLAWMGLQLPREKVLFMFIIPMPMWVAVGVLMVGVELMQLGSNFSGAGSAVAHLAGAAFGAGFWFVGRRRHPAVRRAPVPARGQAPSGLEDAHRLTAMRMAMDRLLDKVSAHGIDSLSDEEKAFLEAASRELRGR